MRILFALLSLVAGLALVFSGYRLARILIPVLGFVAGLSLGGAVIADLAGTVFLGTALGVIIGLVMGAIFAVLAYFYYYLAVLVLTVTLGYWAGSGLVLLVGFSPGLLSALVGIGAGLLAGVLAIVANAPKYVLMVLTAVAGATASVGGVLLLFNRIPLDTYSYNTVHVALSDSFFWTIAALVLIIVGVLAQVRSTPKEYTLDEWGVGHHGGHLPPTTTLHTPGGVR